MLRRTLLVALIAAVAHPVAAQDVNDATEKAMKDAAAKVAPSVVRIETSGGSEAVWGRGAEKGPEVQFRRGVGASTGIVVDPAGYILTSTFNFVGKPTDIFVSVPGKPRTVAKVIGSDPTRMLTMLKIDQTGLPVPPPFPKKEIDVGMWSIALGRTLDPDLSHTPSINGGIVSAVNRIWGKAVQSDAKISPVNYGGPLVAIDGRVMGIIVPISPSSEGETSGFEWYDVGIGFAVPFEDVLAKAVPKLKAGTPEKPVTLRGGLLGVTFKEGDDYAPSCTVDTVAPDTPAEKVGVKPGDNIIEVDGKPIKNRAQLFHQLRPKYEGEKVSFKAKRGDKVEEFKDVVLAGTQTTFDKGFLGVLLMRDDPEPGAEIRFVYPNSPAAKAGLKEGDRIMKVGSRQTGPAPKAPKLAPPGSLPPTGPQPFSGRDQFMTAMQNFVAGAAITLEVNRKDGGKTDKLDVVLGRPTDEIPAELPEESSKKLALTAPKPPDAKAPPKKDEKKDGKKAEGKKDEAKKEEPKKEEPKDEKEKPKTGLMEQKGVGAAGRNFWVFVPETYDPNVAHGLIVWLHPAGRDGRDKDDMSKLWEPFCEKYNLILVGPTAGQPSGWVGGEAEGVMEDVRWVRTRYTIDSKRVIAHGHGVGGQMAYYLGINQRAVIRGVVPVGAVLASNPKEPVANQPVEFLVIAGGKDPIVNQIEDGYKTLVEKKYRASYRVMKITGKEYVNDDADVFREMVRWMDTLDKQ